MELEHNGKTYIVEWDSYEEVYVSDEDGNDVPYDYELYEKAYYMVWEHYVDAADMLHDRMMGR